MPYCSGSCRQMSRRFLAPSPIWPQARFTGIHLAPGIQITSLFYPARFRAVAASVTSPPFQSRFTESGFDPTGAALRGPGRNTCGKCFCGDKVFQSWPVDGGGTTAASLHASRGPCSPRWLPFASTPQAYHFQRAGGRLDRKQEETEPGLKLAAQF